MLYPHYWLMGAVSVNILVVREEKKAEEGRKIRDWRGGSNFSKVKREGRGNALRWEPRLSGRRECCSCPKRKAR